MRDLSSVRLSALSPLLVLAACHGNGGFPSLAQRPAEISFARTVPAAPVREAPGTPDAATLHEVAALRADAVRARDSFAHQADEADHLARAAHASEVGSEAWAAATTALSALDSARSDTAQALGNLDSLRARTAVSAADSNQPSGQATYVAVTDADAAVAAMLGSEDARIAALHKMIGN